MKNIRLSQQSKTALLNKVCNFLQITSTFTKPGFSSILETDAATLFPKISKQQQQQNEQQYRKTSLKVKEQNNQTYSHNNDRNSTEYRKSQFIDFYELSDQTSSSSTKYPIFTFKYEIPKALLANAETQIILKSNSSSSQDFDGDKRTSEVGTHNTILPLSTYLALFDDITTCALMTFDKGSRPGLSIHLSAQKPVQYQQNSTLHSVSKKTFISSTENHDNHNNNIVFFHVEIQKIGNILGFAKIYATTSYGQLLCMGQHTKLLNVDKSILFQLIKVAFHPIILPYTSSFCQMIVDRGWLPKNRNSLSKDVKERIFANKKIQPSSSSSFPDFLTWDEIVETDTNVMGTVQVKDYHCNPVGTFHGGCQSMYMEKVANQHIEMFQLPNNTDTVMDLQSITLNFMSTGKKHSKVLFQSSLLKGNESLRLNDIKHVTNNATICVNSSSSEGDIISFGVLTYTKQ